MIFSSVLFLFRFLPIFMMLYFVVGERQKNMILLVGSLIFYAWGEPVYVLLMLFSILVDFFHGQAIERFRGKKLSGLFLVSSVTINLLLLGFFKYADFLLETLNAMTGWKLPPLNLPLPIGISFYTFQTMSYTIDVYKGEVKAQKNLLDFAVFVTMFPQLIAGPIVKYKDVQRDLHRRKYSLFAVSSGVNRFCIGLAKKVLLANTVGMLWDEISGMNTASLSALSAWLGISAFAFQIYFDFSGYSDMAIGLGEILGFHFPENFDYPYISASVTEFWRRWHISLGSWFREYVYIPLGGNRKGKRRQLIHIFVVWMLTGIWHGAGWNFLLWGTWFALFLSMEKLWLGRLLDRIPRAVGMVYNSFVVLMGWVFFALETPGEIMGYLKALMTFNGLSDDVAIYWGRQYLTVFLFAFIASTPLLKNMTDRLKHSANKASVVLYRFGESVLPTLLLLLSISGIVDASYNPFLYFRF